jgi:hypothetical protein
MKTPALIYLDPEHLERSIAQPALEKLVSDGWTIGTIFVVDDPPRQPRLCLIMLPPARPVASMGWQPFVIVGMGIGLALASLWVFLL